VSKFKRRWLVTYLIVVMGVGIASGLRWLRGQQKEIEVR
jgi:hypothetical protein